MSLIRNLVKEPEKKESKSKADNNSEGDKKPRPIIKSALDLQRLKLEKLMKNPEKPVVIPEHRREKDYMQGVPSFVRNVMGSSAGAGSGEFHVYRHLRRKEYARQKMIQHKSIQEQLDDDYQYKLEENQRISEEKTAKKRAKRLKKKQRSKKPRQEKQADKTAEVNDDDDDSSTDCNDEDADNSEVNHITSEWNITNGPKDYNTILPSECKDDDVSADNNQTNTKVVDVPSDDIVAEVIGDKSTNVSSESIIENNTSEERETKEENCKTKEIVESSQ